MILRTDVIVAFLLKASKGQAANVQRQSLKSYFWLVAGFLSLVSFASAAKIFSFRKLPVTNN
jgi:hypothetical protein